MRPLSVLAAFLLLGFGSTAKGDDAAKLQGSWRITALIEDGTLVSPETIRTRYAQDALFTISGNTIVFRTPGSLQTRTLLFVLNDKATPKTLDLAGTEKTSGKGIYLLAGDVLMICLGEPGVKNRPVDFSADKGEPFVLMTLNRVKDAPAAAKNLPVPPPQPARKTDADIRKILTGSWGHQDDTWVNTLSLNPDGTFSSTRTYKKSFGKLFNPNVRSSGTWKLDEGILICRITASTNKDVANQIFSYRIYSVTPTELLLVDQSGNLRREFRMP